MRIIFKIRGVIVLYNPEECDAAENIESYALHFDKIIVWYSSPIEIGLHGVIIGRLQAIGDKIFGVQVITDS